MNEKITRRKEADCYSKKEGTEVKDNEDIFSKLDE